jgi:hypothetical protein
LVHESRCILCAHALSRAAGYSKWNGGSLGWDITADGSYVVTAQVSDNLATLQALVPASTASTLVYVPVLDAAVTTLGTGRYLRVSPGSRTGSLALFGSHMHVGSLDP